MRGNIRYFYKNMPWIHAALKAIYLSTNAHIPKDFGFCLDGEFEGEGVHISKTRCQTQTR